MFSNFQFEKDQKNKFVSFLSSFPSGSWGTNVYSRKGSFCLGVKQKASLCAKCHVVCLYARVCAMIKKVVLNNLSESVSDHTIDHTKHVRMYETPCRQKFDKEDRQIDSTKKVEKLLFPLDPFISFHSRNEFNLFYFCTVRYRAEKKIILVKECVRLLVGLVC